MIEVVNRQRGLKVPNRNWNELATQILECVHRQQASATIAFVSDAKIRELNRTFRGIDKATDVLSFPSGDADQLNLGDIAISIQTAVVQARQNSLTVEQELSQLILHGLLHLCGYDHETDKGEMNRLELRLRRDLGL